MITVVVYDSVFGNTAAIAKAIAAALEPAGPVRLLPVSEAQNLDLSDVDRLVIGSPTRGFRPLPSIAEFVEGLRPPAHELKAAAFDTRLDVEEIHPAPLRWVVSAGGYAADRISGSLRHHGFSVSEPDAGFIVTGTEGPLKAGELERATAWAKSIFS